MKKFGVVFAAVAVAAVSFASVLTTPASAGYIQVPPGGGPHVRIFSGAGGGDEGGFFAYDPAFAGGVNVAIGDVLGTAAPEVVTGSGPGMPPRVRVWSMGGELLREFNAYIEGFGGGVSVAVADLDSGAGEIITGTGFGGGPHVRVFDANGGLKSEWMAYDPNFTGGIRVAAGQLSGALGNGSVVTAPLFGGGPHVRVFGPNGGVQREWMAYDPNFTGGVNVAAGDGRVVTAPARNGGPHVRVFDGNGNVDAEWMAYDPGFHGGVQVATGQLGGDQVVATAAGPGGGPHVRVFGPGGGDRGGFFAYGQNYTGGVNVAVGNSIVTGAGVPRIIEEILQPGSSGPSVAALQNRLLSMGFWLPDVDGNFGASTTQAVWAFQKANGLPRDGKIGPEDLGPLNAAQRPTAASTSGNLIEVDKGRQLLLIIRNGAVLWAMNTSTGSNTNYSSEGRTYRAVTPEGRFTFDRQIDGYRTSHLGTLYRPKYFTTAGHAIHGSPSIPPYPASHGCVRLSNQAIDFIWAAGLAPLGSQIWVHA